MNENAHLLLPYMTKSELADILRCATRWIELQMRNGMPHRKIGRHPRFQLDAVERWLDSTFPTLVVADEIAA